MTSLMQCFAAALMLCCAQAHAVRVTDDRGVTLDIATPPQRIVSMLPSLTETVCELGACARLVGIDDYSNFPAQVIGLPRLGGLEETSIERVVALKPDLVLLASSSRAVARLEGLGLKVLTLEPKTVADLHRVWLQLGLALGVADAPGMWTRLDTAVDEVARGMPAKLRGTSVYVEVNDGPYAASESSFLGELLVRLGAANIVPGRLGPFPKLNPEFVVRADPQVIVISDREAPSVKSRPGWARMRAVRDGRVCLFTPAQGDVMVRAGPRMAQAARLMADCIAGRWKP